MNSETVKRLFPENADSAGVDAAQLRRRTLKQAAEMMKDLPADQRMFFMADTIDSLGPGYK